MLRRLGGFERVAETKAYVWFSLAHYKTRGYRPFRQYSVVIEKDNKSNLLNALIKLESKMFKQQSTVVNLITIAEIYIILYT